LLTVDKLIVKGPFFDKFLKSHFELLQTEFVFLNQVLVSKEDLLAF